MRSALSWIGMVGVIGLMAAGPALASADPIEDTSPPVVSDFERAPAIIDTTSSSQLVHLKVKATDPIAGVLVLTVVYRSPSGNQTVVATTDGVPPSSGNDNDGTWDFNIEFPQFSELGDWELVRVSARDKANNFTSYTPADLGVDGTVTVVGVADTEAPSVTEFTRSPSVINTTLSSQFVNLRVKATDPIAGVLTLTVVYRSPSGNQIVVATTDGVPPSAGDDKDGTWDFNIEFPQFSELGGWELVRVSARDKANNFTSYTPADLGVDGTVTVVGTGDTSPPVVTEFERAPATIDTTFSSQLVHLKVKATDPIAGVLVLTVVYRSPSGNQTVVATTDGIPPSAGNDNDGTWDFNIEFPQFSELGDWELVRVSARDKANNFTSYTPADLGVDGTVTVTGVPTTDPDVKITKTASPDNPRPGDIVTYSLKAENIGTAIAKDVKITDSLPVGVTFVSADAPCVLNAGTVNCAIGDLNPVDSHTYQVKVKVDPIGTFNSANDHLLDVQKVETQIDLEAGEQKTVTATCPSGYFVSDGSVRIDHIDQGTGDWTAPQVLESYASSLDTWKGVVKNTATGRAQAKIFAVCINKKTVDGDHSHDLIVTNPITVSDAVLAGKKTATLQCGPGQIAIEPGFQSSKPADLQYSEPEGNGWKFVLDVSEPANVTFSIRCLTRQVSITNGHTHDLKFEHIKTEVTIEAGKVNETQLTCADGSKGIVADMDLDDGLKSLGNDPRPVTRAFKIYDPTDHALKARLSLLCLGLRTGGEHAPPVTLINTAMISTISFESQTGNNTSSATVIAEDTDNHTPVTPTDPVKPVPNNLIAQTRIGGSTLFKKNTVTGSITCTGACSGTAKLVSLKTVKVKGKKFKKGTVLASAHYKLNAAGTKKLTLKVKGTKAKQILKKSKHGQIQLSNGTKSKVSIK